MKTKHIILILTILILLLVCGVLLISIQPSQAYKTYTFNDTNTTLEVPMDLKLRQDISEGGIRLMTLSTPDGDIVIERSLSDNPYMAESLEGASDLMNSYDGDKINGVELSTCSRTVKNDRTGEVIMVSSSQGDNETVEHIIGSVRWGDGSKVDDNSSNNDSDDGRKVLAYKSDGTPMYSQEEVDEYVKSKYGLVNYHIQGNGYINLDDPNYDDAGNRVVNDNGNNYYDDSYEHYSDGYYDGYYDGYLDSSQGDSQGSESQSSESDQKLL